MDLHRGQIAFDALQVESGEVWRGRVRQLDRARLRRWLTDELAPRAKDGSVEVVVEGCTGWRYVVDEVTAAGFVADVPEPADTQAARGRRKRAQTDRSDAKLLRELLQSGDLPESWIPPEGVVEWRERIRLYKTVLDQGRMWIQRTHVELFPAWREPARGPGRFPPNEGLADRRRGSPDRGWPSAHRGRISRHRYHRRHAPAIASRARALRSAPAGMQSSGCCSLRDRPAELRCSVGRARGLSSVLPLHASSAPCWSGVTVDASDRHRGPGHLSRQGPETLRWALFEAGMAASRPSSPDRDYYQAVKQAHDGKVAAIAMARKLVRRCYHTLREMDPEVVYAMPS